MKPRKRGDDGLMTARYDEVATEYGTGSRGASPALSALVQRCGDVDGLDVLDLACGHGVAARLLARAGARVHGLDVSTKLLGHARRLEDDDPLGIQFHQGDASDPATLIDARFALVVCNFGLSDIDDLDGVVINVARWLQPGGRFVCSLLHPCFAGGDGASSSWPADGGYFDERWWRADGHLSTLRQVVGSNHRTLSTYVNTMRSHGLVIDALDEPMAETSWTVDRPDAARQPVYLVITCRSESQS